MLLGVDNQEALFGERFATDVTEVGALVRTPQVTQQVVYVVARPVTDATVHRVVVVHFDVLHERADVPKRLTAQMAKAVVGVLGFCSGTFVGRMWRRPLIQIDTVALSVSCQRRRRFGFLRLFTPLLQEVAAHSRRTNRQEA